MNQDIFNQLAQEQDNFNAYQGRFNNELSNFDMDKRTQQITQQASDYAVDQAKKASGALSNQLLGTDITETAMATAPLLYKGGQYFRAKGASGIANDVREGVSTAAGAVQSRVGNAINTLRGQVGDVVGQVTAEGENGYQTVQQNMRDLLPKPQARLAGLADESSVVRSRLQGGGVEGMGGGEFRVQGGQLVRASTGAPADFRAAADPLGSRATQFSRDAEPDFRGTAQTQARLDEMSRNQESNIGGIPEFQRPVQPRPAPVAEPEPTPEPVAPRGAPPTAQDTFLNRGGRINPTQPEIPQATSNLGQSPYETDVGQRMFTRARTDADFSSDNPSISSENPVPRELPSGRQVNLTPWEPPESATSRYDPNSVANPLERSAGAGVGEDVAEAAGVAEDVAEPELALAQPVLSAAASADIPVVSQLARGAENVVGGIGKDIENIFTPAASAASQPTNLGDFANSFKEPEVGGLEPEAGGNPIDSLAPMREMMARNQPPTEVGGGPPPIPTSARPVEAVNQLRQQNALRDFPEPPTGPSGPSPELQSRVADLPSRVEPDQDIADMNERLQTLQRPQAPEAPALGTEPSPFNAGSVAKTESLGADMLGGVEKTAPIIEDEVESGVAELPGVGEALMGITALGGLIGGLFEHHQAQKEMDATPAPVAPSMPQAPRAPQESFQVAPTIDSTNFHNH